MAVKTDKHIKQIIAKYALQLRNAGIPVEKIILFGSYARNMAREDSDIDLAIVLKEIEEDRFAARLKLMKYCRIFDDVIEPHPFLNEEFNMQNPFAAEIMKDGITIYS